MNNEAMGEVGALSGAVKIVFTTIVLVFANITAYLNINTEALAIYFILLTIDLVSGILASFIAKEPITKSRLGAGILSKGLMFIVPITIALIVKIQSTDGMDLLWFVKYTVIVLAVSEAISIFNNILKAKGKETLPEFDAISMIASKLRIMLEKLFDTADGKR